MPPSFLRMFCRIPTLTLTVVEADGRVSFEVRKGMYGLKDTGLTNMKPHCHAYMPFTAGMWQYSSRPTTLCVDDFGVKYLSKADALHLINAVKTNYSNTVDWTGSLYCGINLDWNYEQGYVDISMKGYVKRSLKRFEHIPSSTRTQHAPHPWQTLTYDHKHLWLLFSTNKVPSASKPSPATSIITHKWIPVLNPP